MKNEDEVDRITQLPEEAKELILRLVPLQDAVRTSALSRQWRNNWRNTTEIDLDEIFHNYLNKKYHSVDKNDFVRIIYDVLLNHEVPILSFQLYITDQRRPSEEAVGSWIHSLSKNGVRALSLVNVSKQGLYKLPSRFYSGVELISLTLSGFHFKPPSTFQGFPNLEVLHFKGNTFDEEPFQRFITSCPLLRHITLICNESPKDIVIICSESLKYLNLRGELKSVFVDAHGLETLGIFPDSPMILNSQLPQVNITIVNALGNLQRVKTLRLGGHALKFLAAGGLPHKCPMDSLTYIEFDLLDFEDHDQISFVVHIIQNAPYLRHLQIKSYWTESYGGISGVSLGDDITLDCLKTVEFSELRGLNNEFYLVMSLLACSPSLEKMTIKAKPIAGSNGVDVIPAELMRYSRVSPKAEIHYSKSN